MKQLLFILTLLALATTSIYAQGKYKYHFAEHSVTYTAEELSGGKKLQINDTCYYLFKFYDERKSTINQTMFCNEKQEEIIRYSVPKELTTLTTTSYRQEPPYERYDTKEKVYWIKLN